MRNLPIHSDGCCLARRRLNGMTFCTHNIFDSAFRYAGFASQRGLSVLPGSPQLPCGLDLLWRRLRWAIHLRPRCATPVVAGHYLPDSCLRDIEGAGQFYLLYVAFRIFAANFQYLLFGQLCAALSGAVGNAIALHSIAAVIPSGAKFQMVRAHARRPIAFMANDHTIRYRAIMDSVRQNVPTYGPSRMIAKPDGWVVPAILAAPEPAALRFNDLAPKPIHQGAAKAVSVAAFYRAETRASGNFASQALNRLPAFSTRHIYDARPTHAGARAVFPSTFARSGSSNGYINAASRTLINHGDHCSTGFIKRKGGASNAGL